MSEIIGRISATEKAPSTTTDFTFWIKNDTLISPFDIVKVENIIAGSKYDVYGIVRDIHHLTDSPSHLASFVSSDFGDVTVNCETEKLQLTFALCDVIGTNSSAQMPCLDGSPVEFVDVEGAKIALGLDDIEQPLPAGMFRMTNNVSLPIQFNKQFLLGPEGAHANISGISGLATKTSYAMFLLKAIQEHSDDVAFIVFNVKGSDLLQLDQPNDQLSAADEKDWRELGLEPEPFQNVTYYYPYKNGKAEEDGPSRYALTACPKESLQLQEEQGRFHTFAYTYPLDRAKMDLLFTNIDDPNFTIESILDHIQTDREYTSLGTWDDLMDRLKLIKTGDRQQSETTNIPIQSWRKFRRLIRNSIKHSVFQDAIGNKPEKCNVHLEDALNSIEKGSVHVVDIAKLDEQLQCFVFGDVMNSIYNLKLGEVDTAEVDPPKHIVVFVDELNKYAPANAPKNSPILTQILEITERGRSMGIILISAEQFKSAVHQRVTGNCSTSVFGRTNSMELANKGYSFIPKTSKYSMTNLRKGELLIQHPVFRTILKVVFPKPVYKQQ